jgi:hypothetical protein
MRVCAPRKEKAPRQMRLETRGLRFMSLDHHHDDHNRRDSGRPGAATDQIEKRMGEGQPPAGVTQAGGLSQGLEAALAKSRRGSQLIILAGQQVHGRGRGSESRGIFFVSGRK